MNILCSDAMKIFGIVLLVAGLAALSLGICGLVMAPVGAAIIAAISISSVSVITTGVGMATASGGLFAGRFFAAKKWKNDNEKSMQAVHVINDVDEPMPTMV
jgi:hypothetical protein